MPRGTARITVPRMDILRQIATVLTPWDWFALLFFFIAWIGYARFAKRRADVQPSLLAASNRIRRQWMIEATRRENRVFDGVVVQNLSTSPSFFASTTILIVGGLLALLGTGNHAQALVSELPFAARTTALVLDMKLVLLTGIFVYSFFRFTWSLRQYSFGALLVAAAPDLHAFDAAEAGVREQFADRAGGVVGLAAESFNDGLRGYYFAFAAAAWLFSPWAFVIGSAGVVWVLYQREFQSEALALMLR
jgi:uncharacterized membrane protein